MAPKHSYFVYVGTYTRRPGSRSMAEGIYVYRLSSSTGALQPVGLVPGIVNPSFLAIAPDHNHLYAISEIDTFGGERSGAVSAFAIGRTSGMLSLLNQEATHGASSCYISIDATGRWVLTANYRGGSASVLPILADGRVGAMTAFMQHSGPSGVNPKRQEAAHAHSIIPDPSNRYVLVADLGMDKIMVYRLDSRSGTLEPHDPPFIASRPGAGPRHQVFHPNGRSYYVVNELDSTVSVIEWDVARASGREVQVISTLPKDFTGVSYCAEIRIAPSGRFVYASNRGHDSIAVFAVAEKTGLLSAAGHVSTQGKCPRGFELTPTGDLLLAANQDTDTIVPFWVDQATGQLTPTGHVVPSPMPVCIKMTPAP